LTFGADFTHEGGGGRRSVSDPEHGDGGEIDHVRWIGGWTATTAPAEKGAATSGLL